MSERSERPTTPEAMLERLEQMEAEAQATLRKYEELSEQLGADAVEVFSEDGLVAVKLDAEGELDTVKIDEMAMRQKQTLGPAIVQLIREARATYGVKMADMAQELVGDKLDVREMMNRYMPQELQDKARENLARPGDGR